MSLLGFDALGRLALAQLPSITSGPSFSSFSSAPLPTKLGIAVVTTTYAGFVPAPVQAPRAVFTSFSQPTSKSVQQPTQSFVVQPVAQVVTVTPVFTEFSRPVSAKVQHTDINFRVLRPDSATPGPLVFAAFPAQTLQKKVDVNSQTDVKFRVLRPDAATPGSISFNPFSEPRFNSVRPQSPSGFFAPPPGVVVGGDFADFDLVQSKRPQQQGFTNFTFRPVVQTTVFTQFSQPTAVNPKQSEPTSTLFQQPVVVNVVTGGTFADWEFLQTKKQNHSWSSFSQVFPAQTAVFSVFSAPLPKKILQQDQSFVTFPVVQVVTQPYVFSDFGQPQYKRVLQDQPANFTVFPQPAVVQTVTLSFSDFGMPRKTVFLQSDFLDTPVNPAVQNYVFTQFSQPQVGKVIREGFVNAPIQSFTQNYVFLSFDQPQARRVLQQDTSFVTFPVVVQAVQPYIFLPFDQPRFKPAPQFDTSVQFQVLPPPQVISVYQFTGFSDFNNQIFYPLRVDLGGILYDIFVPVTPPVEEQLAGWRKNKYLWPNKTVKLDSSNVEELEFDPNTGEMKVIFKGGREYQYHNVQAKQAKGLERSKSPGKYVNTKLRGKFPTTRIR